MTSPTKYIVHTVDPESQLPNAREELIKSLTTIVLGSPPRKPWTDSFKANPQGLWTGPTSIAYLFFWLSRNHPDLIIENRVPKDWCLAYLDCGSDKHPIAGSGIGVKNEYMAYNAVKAIATNDLECVEKLKDAAFAVNEEAPAVDNEFLSGRAGTLALLRIVRHWIPGHQPWAFHDVAYIGAAHGDIGIITQMILCIPNYASVLEPNIIEILEAQREDGNWYVRRGQPDPTNLVQFCHGAPGIVLSLMKLRPYFPSLQSQIDSAIDRGRKCIWEQGVLKKEPNLCHGVTGNALALASTQREPFMTYATAERINAGIEDGSYIKGDDRYGLQWGEAGRAWGWMVLDSSDVDGWPSYTDV